jgi:hypothetical protein
VKSALKLLGVALVLAGAAGLTRRAAADDGADQAALASERCANRLSIAFTGNATTETQSVDALLANADFQDRFGRFINSQFNDSVGASGSTSAENAPYFMTKYVLAQDLPWTDLFQGKLDAVWEINQVVVRPNDDGLGYFRVDDWYKRYEGNEPNGIKLSTAYRIMNNVVGLKLTAVPSDSTPDQTATGRQAMPCKTCHYDNWSALDKVASILPKRGEPFDAYQGPKQEMLGGQQIGNDAELVGALLASENFAVNSCRLAFHYLYGRPDDKCDGPMLDQCVTAFKADKKIQTALKTIASDPGFCE